MVNNILSSAGSCPASVVCLGARARARGRQIAGWQSMGFLMLALIVCAEAQTFQYSRGWTNGKRSGNTVYGSPSAIIGPYDLETAGILGSEPEMIFPSPGHLQMNPSARFRSVDSNQYLVKRMATAGNTRKPLWFGTILGVDGAESSGSGSSTSNSNPSGNSRSSGSDF